MFKNAYVLHIKWSEISRKPRKVAQNHWEFMLFSHQNPKLRFCFKTNRKSTFWREAEGGNSGTSTRSDEEILAGSGPDPGQALGRMRKSWPDSGQARQACFCMPGGGGSEKSFFLGPRLPRPAGLFYINLTPLL